MDGFYFDNTPASDYRLTFLDGCYKELRKPAKPKGTLINNWPDEHGTERDLSTRYLETRTLTLPVMIEGVSEVDFSLKHQAFNDWILAAGYFDLKVERLNRIYTLIYDDISDYRDFYTFCTFNLILLDDYPHIITPIA